MIRSLTSQIVDRNVQAGSFVDLLNCKLLLILKLLHPMNKVKSSTLARGLDSNETGMERGRGCNDTIKD